MNILHFSAELLLNLTSQAKGTRQNIGFKVGAGMIFWGDKSVPRLDLLQMLPSDGNEIPCSWVPQGISW